MNKEGTARALKAWETRRRNAARAAEEAKVRRSVRAKKAWATRRSAQNKLELHVTVRRPGMCQ